MEHLSAMTLVHSSWDPAFMASSLGATCPSRSSYSRARTSEQVPDGKLEDMQGEIIQGGLSRKLQNDSEARKHQLEQVSVGHLVVQPL